MGLILAKEIGLENFPEPLEYDEEDEDN